MLRGTRVLTGADAIAYTSAINTLRGCLHRS